MTTTPALDDMLQYSREWLAAGVHPHGFHVYRSALSALVDHGDVDALVMAQRLLNEWSVSHQPYENGDREAWIVAVSGQYKGVYASAQGTYDDPEPALKALGETSRATDETKLATKEQ